MFEQSLQTIDPSIALPYWDFTIEGMHFDWTNFRSSSVFSDDWFGYAAPTNVRCDNTRHQIAPLELTAPVVLLFRQNLLGIGVIYTHDLQ